MTWNPAQYAHLTEHYRNLSDGDLLHLAASPEDLTEIAHEVLTKEIASRDLQPAPTEETPHREPVALGERSVEERQIWYDYAAKAPAHCVFAFGTIRQANDGSAFLAESGIESQVLGTNSGDLDLRGPRLVVRPGDADEAAAILAQPMPAHISDEPDAEAEEFALPECPRCHAPDPLLESVDPVNHWLCEACEHAWDDPESD